MSIRVIRSFAFALFFYTLTVPWVIASGIAGIFGQDALSVVVAGWCRMHRFACRWLLGQKIRVEGILPAEPMLIICKHESMFETIDIGCIFSKPVIAAKKQLLDIPGWGWIARRYGVIEVDREAGAKALRKLRKAALQAIHQGRPVILFPEGTRVPHGSWAPLRAGFAGLYQLLALPVLPIAVDSGKLSPRNSFLKEAGIITYRIGPVIPPGLSRAEAEARAIAALNALNPPGRDGL